MTQLDIRLGQKVKSKAYFGWEVKPDDVGFIKEIESEYLGNDLPILERILYTLHIQFGDYTLVIKKEPINTIKLFLENYEEPNDSLDSMRYGLEYMKRKTPIDTTTRFEDMSDIELVDIFTKEFNEFSKKIRFDLPIYAFQLPYLNYNKKGKENMEE